MTVEVAEKLIQINPYLMATVLVCSIIVTAGLIQMVAWLVRHIITRKESETDSVVGELKTAIDGLRISQESNTRDLRSTMTETSNTTAEMASFMREKLDETASRIHGRIDKLTQSMTEKFDETNSHIAKETRDRARLGVVLSSDISEIRGRCDARAQMCPHVKDVGHSHCVPPEERNAS